MGSTANLAARAFAKAQYNEGTGYAGCLGTGVVKLSKSLNVGRTGLTETQAVEAGYSVVSNICVVDDKAHYYPGAASFIVKMIADADSRKLLGIQVLGAGAVDKMVDIAVTGISKGMTIDEFDSMDYAYAPPFSTAIHPFVTACYILENKMDGVLNSMTPAEEIKRLKGLGCLQDKRFDDVFNIRVITRNGKLTTAEQISVAKAAEMFGSGEVTMTTRLTLEIQGVPYDNVDAL